MSEHDERDPAADEPEADEPQARDEHEPQDADEAAESAEGHS